MNVRKIQVQITNKLHSFDDAWLYTGSPKWAVCYAFFAYVSQSSNLHSFGHARASSCATLISFDYRATRPVL